MVVVWIISAAAPAPPFLNARRKSGQWHSGTVWTAEEISCLPGSGISISAG